MNSAPAPAPTKVQACISATTKKRRASSAADTMVASVKPAAKRARVEAKKPKMAKEKIKKGPACATCRKKKIKCAHRLELDSVTKQPSTLSAPSNQQTKPSSSSSSSSSSPSSSSSSSSNPPTSTKPGKVTKDKPAAAAPDKIRKLDRNRDATPEFRLRIQKDRQSCRIQFTEEDWYRKPSWASRVPKG